MLLGDPYLSGGVTCASNTRLPKVQPAASYSLFGTAAVDTVTIGNCYGNTDKIKYMNLSVQSNTDNTYGSFTPKLNLQPTGFGLASD